MHDRLNALPKAELHPAPGGLARTRAALPTGATQRRGPALARYRRAARRVRLRQSPGIPGPLLPGRGRAANRAGLLRPDLGLSAEVPRAERDPYRALLRSPDPYRPRRAAGSGAGGHRPGAGGRAQQAGGEQRPDPELPAPPARRTGDGRAGGRAALSRRLHRRRPGQQRKRLSAAALPARVRPRARRGAARRGPRGRRRPAGIHLGSAGPAQGAAHRPRGARRRRPAADRPPDRRADSVDRLPPVQYPPARVRAHAPSQHPVAAGRGREGDRQLRRPGVLRRLRERELPCPVRASGHVARAGPGAGRQQPGRPHREAR